MAFINKHDTVAIHTALTQEGKKRLADGDLRIERIAFSDAEINYSFGSGITYSHLGNHITAMPYRRGGSIFMNYDGTAPYELGPDNVVSITALIAEPVDNLGFYTNIANGSRMADYRVDTSLCLATGYTPTNWNSIGVFGAGGRRSSFNLSGETNDPPTEGMVFVRFVAPYGSAVNEEGENVGYYANFFRYVYDPTIKVIHVDRAIPRYDFPSVNKEQPLFFYPLSGYSQYYGSGTTTVCPVWNMNIHSKVTHIAGNENPYNVVAYPTTASDYYNTDYPADLALTDYGSRQISGVVKALGLDHLPRCGVIHYSNSYSGDVYGDYIMPRETQVDIPHILWHRNGSGVDGTSLRGGLKLTDSGSEIFYDTTGKTSFTILKDGSGPNAQIVGRVYYEMKIIAITDQELLIAMDAKNNRNWTCPPLKVELVSQTDNALIQGGGYSGLAVPGKRYYVTYHIVSYPGNGPRQSVPCAYVQTIDGQYDDDGEPMYIKATFPPSSFPFHRSALPSFSGVGMHVNAVQMMIQEVDIVDDPGILGLSPFKWVVAPAPSGYDISRFGNIPSSLIMSPTLVNSLVFYATQQEFSGANYFNLEAYTNSTGIGQGLTAYGRNFWHGDTEMFFGNITAKRVTKNYIRNVRFFVEKDYLNTTTNPTYLSGSTFITEVFLLGNDNKVLGVAKPDRPIEKNDITVIDFSFRSHY